MPARPAPRGRAHQEAAVYQLAAAKDRAQDADRSRGISSSSHYTGRSITRPILDVHGVHHLLVILAVRERHTAVSRSNNNNNKQQQ